MLFVGFAKAKISPPIGAPLAGFAARDGVCEGIHDDLYTRALVLESGGNIIVLVSLDVLALPSDFVNNVRERIRLRTGIRRESIVMASTHTHAGPVTVKTFFNPDDSLDQGFMDLVANAIEDSVATAWESREPSRVGVGSGHVEGIGVNRRSPDRKPVDEEIGIIKVEDMSKRLRAVLINYSCHPTVLGSDNLLASGDFPYFAIERIEKELGTPVSPDVVAARQVEMNDGLVPLRDANVRRMINAGTKPPKDSVRIEEMIVGKTENYRPVAPGPPANSVSPANTAPGASRT